MRFFLKTFLLLSLSIISLISCSARNSQASHVDISEAGRPFTAEYSRCENYEEFKLVFTLPDYHVEYYTETSRNRCSNIQIGKRVHDYDPTLGPNVPFYPIEFYNFDLTPFLKYHINNINPSGYSNYYVKEYDIPPSELEGSGVTDTTWIKYWVFTEDFRGYSSTTHQMEHAGKIESLYEEDFCIEGWQNEYIGPWLYFKEGVVEERKYIPGELQYDLDLSYTDYQYKDTIYGRSIKWTLETTELEFEFSPNDDLNIGVKFSIVNGKPSLRNVITTDSTGITANLFDERGLLETIVFKSEPFTEVYHYDTDKGWLLRKETFVTNNPTSYMVETYRVESEYEVKIMNEQ